MEVQRLQSNGNIRMYSAQNQNSQSYQASSAQEYHSKVSKSSYSANKAMVSNNISYSSNERQENRAMLKNTEENRKSMGRCKTNPDAASISSISDTDDSFVWKADPGSSVGESDHDLMESYIKALEERGVMHPGDLRGQPEFTESTTTSRVVSGNKVTKTTKTVVKSSSHQTTNGIEDNLEYETLTGKMTPTGGHQRGNSVSSATSSLRNGYANERTPLVRTGSNASSIASGRGMVENTPGNFSTVATSVLADGSVVTTYTSRTTTIHDDPTVTNRQQFVRASPAPSSTYVSDNEGNFTHSSRQYSSLRSNKSQSYQTSSTLPRQPLQNNFEPHLTARSATLPRPSENNYTPVVGSAPESQVLEEERINPDGSRVYIKKVVTTTTTCTTEPDDEFVEVTMAPETEVSYEDKRAREMSELQRNQVERASVSSYRSEASSRSYRSTTPRQPYTSLSGPGYVRPADGRAVEEPMISKTATVLHADDGGIRLQRSRTPSYSTDTAEGERILRATFDRSSTRSTDSKGVPKSRTLGDQPRVEPPLLDASRIEISSGRPNGAFTEEDFDRPIYQVEPSQAASGVSEAGLSVRANKGYIVDEKATAQIVSRAEGDLDDEKKRPPSYGDYEDADPHGYEIDLLDLLMFLKTDDDILKANAAGYIMHLCYNDEAIKIKMRELDLIPLLVRLLDHMSEDCHRNAAGALKNLSYGRFLDDNKAAIQECGGIPACVRLLYRTNSLEVREHVSGILYNLSSSTTVKVEILDDAVEALSVLIVIPLSGWERQSYLEDRPPNMVIWSVLLRNATGALRNVSSIGPESRDKIRRQEGLVDALVWMMRAAIAQDKNDIDNKIVENIMCILRNISYKLDTEIDHNIYPDAIKIISEPEETPVEENVPASKRKGGNDKPSDASTTGCLYMKKKPAGAMKKRLSFKKKNAKSPPEPTEQYKKPDVSGPTLGVALLWEPETVSLYLYLIDKSNNSFTLEAACGAVHNLCAGNWNWSALLRAHIRRERGLPPINELLTVEQEYIVRAAALALRNLAIDKKNKGLIGRYAIKELLAVLPPPNTPEDSLDPTDYTIVALLGTIGVVIHGNLENCEFFRDNGGIGKVMALTREPDPKREKPLRIYSQRVVMEANRVLLYAWEFKEIQTTIKRGFWSYGKALEEERAYKNATLKQPKKQGDVYAELEDDSVLTATLPRDSRRFVTVTENDSERRSSIEKLPPSPTTPTFDSMPAETKNGDKIEMQPVKRTPYIVEEDDGPVLENKPLLEKPNENGLEPDEHSPLYAKVEKKKKNDGDIKADSWV